MNFPMPLVASSISIAASNLIRKIPAKKAVAFAIPIGLVVSFVAFGTGSPPNIPGVNLSADPLYAPAQTDKPVLALALSVEFPTVGAQYVDPDNNNGSATDDPSYSPTIEYLGYYDAESCYTYDDAGTGAPAGQMANYKRFVRRGPAIPLATPDANNSTWTSRMCWDGAKSYIKDDGTSPASSVSSNDAFSGNFLNWASSSAIDMLRLAMTGGDRLIDTPTLTVLQRAMIPDGNPISMGNSTNFPAKLLYRNGTSRGVTTAAFASPSYVSGVSHFGAVPSSMSTAAGGDIYVANTLNRIYFGTTKTGNNSAGFNGNYTLGGAPPTIQKGPQTNNNGATLPSDAVLLGGETATAYTFSGVREIWFGSNDAQKKWTVLPASGGIDCTWTGGGGAYGGINDPQSGVAKNCYSRPYTGSWAPTASASGLNSDGYFYARVQVCDRDASYMLKDKRYWALCSKYSDGAATPHDTYKPTGVVQKYSDKLRLAAFGYLLDQTASYSSGRYGGVLRAPVKYVGAKTFDVNGLDNTPAGGNPNQEWNPITGVFYSNPDSNASVATLDGRNTYLSGVVSYLNQFGRTGSVLGRYKYYDPIGELHYETLRYLQGLQPSAAAVSGITTDMQDGYPVYISWTDPYGSGRSSSSDYSCLKSNIVVIGDKNTHDGNRLPSLDVANNVPDINAWRTVVQNFEKNNTSGTYTDGQGVSRTTGNPNGANNSVPSGSQTSQIMGTAYWARTHDIRGTSWSNASDTYGVGDALQRPGLRAKTFVFDVNEYGASNSASARRSSNQLFMAAKYGGFEVDPSNTAKNPYNTWGNPFKQDDGTANKYVWEDTDTRTSRIGEANTYFLQSDARGVLSAFDDIFARASTSARSIAGGAIQSKSLTQVGGIIYQGTFDTSDWSGDLLAIPVNVNSSNVVSLGNNFSWTAATQLSAMSSPATTRKIFVGNDDSSAATTAYEFKWADISALPNLRAALNKINPSASSDGLGADRLNYLRGDKSRENNPFRARAKLLGDVINSGVVYAGAPTTTINESGYNTFYTTNKNRTTAVYVGANDGMLHAFNGATGNELFAYIPSWLGPKLSALSDPTYISSHQSYVDGTPAVAEAQVGSTWKTVLVSGTGGGGKGVFGLDVTDPSTFDASKVMWEFTERDDGDLGYVTGRPQILKLKVSGTANTYKWFAVFGSGVNNYIAGSSGIFSTSGSPTLFLLDLSKSAGTAWSLGTNYFKVNLPVDSTISATMATGLINFSAAIGPAREVTQIYMGDLHGNLWKLDFSGLGTADWNMGMLSYYKQGTSNNPIPMFIATDGSGTSRATDKRQPISASPSLVYGPIPNSTYVLFGTGKYYEVADKSTTQKQSAYMVYDDGTTTLDTTPASAATVAVSDRRRLKAGSANTSSQTVSVPTFVLGRAANNTDSSNPRSGWYFDFPYSKERQVSNATVVGADRLVFGTLIPGASTTAACAASGGGGNKWQINILTGTGTFSSSGSGVMGEPLVADITSATTYTISDSTGRRIKTIVSVGITPGSDGMDVFTPPARTVLTGRLTWRQINNYQELKN